MDPANAGKKAKMAAKWAASREGQFPTVPRQPISSSMIHCYLCGQMGHIKMHCPKNGSSVSKSGGIPEVHLGGLAQGAGDNDPFNGRYDDCYLANFAGDSASL
jgi:hypothetical protein